MRFGVMALFASLLMGSATLAKPSTQSVTVILQFEHPDSSVSVQSMQREVRTILGKSVDVRFSTSSEFGQSSPGRLVVLHMRGYCTMAGPNTEAPQGGVALASTFVSDGTVLPFGEVQCDRVRGCVQQLFGDVNPGQHQKQYGLALGRVIAHELYHILAGSEMHTGTGVTKPGLSPYELVSNSAKLPASAEAAIENPTQEILR
jgi:hypothetical protein